MISSKGWKQWLNNHATKDKYNKIADKIREIIIDTSATTNFKKLCVHNNLVLLTTAQLGAKIQTSFYHLTIYIPIIPEDVHHVARVGLSTGSGMGVEPSSLFVKTESKHHPSMVDMMKVAIVEELTALAVDTTKAKRKCHYYALVTPLLAEAI